MATILIEIGNPVLSDDSVGLKVARRVGDLLPAESDTAVRDAASPDVAAFAAAVWSGRRTLLV